ASPSAREANPASTADGARYTPPSSIRCKKRLARWASLSLTSEHIWRLSAPLYCRPNVAPSFFCSRRRHTRFSRDWSSDVCSSDLGKDNMLLFLTADHAVSYVTSFLVEEGVPGGYIDNKENTNALRDFLKKKYGEDLYLTMSNYDIFLNRPLIEEKGLELAKVQQEVAQFMMTLKGVAGAIPATELANGEFTQRPRSLVQKGYNQKRSGDVSIWLEPQTLSG